MTFPLENTLIVVAGPTASGKTDLAIRLAQAFNSEIISADSRQFFRELPIGTAAPTAEQQNTIKHHFVGHISIRDEYNIAKFESDALRILEDSFRKTNPMIMAGGSGLYIKAVCKGIDELPVTDAELRKELTLVYESQGIEGLRQKLKVLDPGYYRKVDLNNPVRLMRALEVCIQTGKPYSSFRLNNPKERDFRIIKIGIDIPRDLLNTRINERTDLMLQQGWLEEAKSLLSFRNLNALNTVGYKELFKYLDGDWPLKLAVEKIKTNTRRYAKRQMTWFRRDPEIKWFDGANVDEIIEYLREELGGRS